MIVFEKQLLDNTFLVEEAKQLESSGFIDSEELKKITKETPILKSQNNLLIRFCFIILGSLLYGGICGSLAVFGLSLIDSHWEIIMLFYGLVGVVGQEFIYAKSSHFFGYGLDDAAIFGAMGCFVGFVAEYSYNDQDSLGISLVLLIISVLMYLRYLHTPSVLIGFLSLTASVFFFLMEYILFGKEIMPFVLLFLGALVYFFAKKKNNALQVRYYQNGLLVLKVMSLLLMYISVNYYVVRELSALLADQFFEQSPQIPMAWLFYGFTFIFPAVYIYFGLKNKDKWMLWVGVLCLAFTVYTVRFYHHVLPTEIALTISGIILFAIAYFSIRKLKNKESGITFMPDRFESSNSLLSLETLASAAQFGIKPELKTPDSPMDFGGGGFSGGGAGEKF